MLNYQVDAWPHPETEALTIRIKTTDRGSKEGFAINVTEEWILKHLYQIAEGEQYPQIRPYWSDGS